MGEATLKKILCLQETLRGVAGAAPLTESLLQVDRVLLRPSPLLQDKRLRFHWCATHTRALSGHTIRPVISQCWQALLSANSVDG